MFEYSMSTKNIKPILQVNLEGLRKKFYTDMQVFESIFFHLFSNAVKFSSSNSNIIVSVELEVDRDQDIIGDDML